jgi:hypothetical protein
MSKKEHFALMPQQNERNPLVDAVNIAKAQRPKDPYHHDWVRIGGIIRCSKCGRPHLDKVWDGRVNGTMCTVSTDAPVN